MHCKSLTLNYSHFFASEKRLYQRHKKHVILIRNDCTVHVFQLSRIRKSKASITHCDHISVFEFTGLIQIDGYLIQHRWSRIVGIGGKKSMGIFITNLDVTMLSRNRFQTHSKITITSPADQKLGSDRLKMTVNVP